MATNHGNHIVKYAGNRTKTAPTDATGVCMILDKSHDSFRMGGGSYNRNNGGWFLNFKQKTSLENNALNYTQPQTYIQNVTYPNLTAATNDVLSGQNSAPIDLGWQKQNNKETVGWLNIERSIYGLLYPIHSISNGDVKYEIRNVQASDWFTRTNSVGGNNYNRIINIHGDYTGEVPLANTTRSNKYNCLLHESGGSSMAVMNIFGNVKLTIPTTYKTTHPIYTPSLVFVYSDDMQAMINVFGTLEVSSEGKSYILNEINRGAKNVHVMPGGNIITKGDAAITNPRYPFFAVWGNGKYSGKIT